MSAKLKEEWLRRGYAIAKNNAYGYINTSSSDERIEWVDADEVLEREVRQIYALESQQEAADRAHCVDIAAHEAEHAARIAIDITTKETP